MQSNTLNYHEFKDGVVVLSPKINGGESIIFFANGSFYKGIFTGYYAQDKAYMFLSGKNIVKFDFLGNIITKK